MPETVVKTLQDSSLSQQYVSQVQAIGLPSSKLVKHKKMDAKENHEKGAKIVNIV